MAITIMIFYLVLTTAIGIYVLKTNKDAADYLVAKRNLGLILVAALLFGELLSGASTVGKATEAFNIGITAVWINWGQTLGIALLIFLGISKFFRVFGYHKGIMSVPEAYKYLFDRKTSIVMMIVIVAVYAIIFALQPLAAANILGPMFGIDRFAMAIIVGLILTVVTLAGGLRGLAVMNVVHATVMFTGMALVAWAAVGHAGGWSALTQTLPPTHFDLLQPDIMTVIAWAFGTGFSFFCAASVGQVAFGAKSTKIANRGMLIAALAVIPYAVLPAIVGMAAKVAYPDMSSATALFSMAYAISPLMGAIASIAVIAAIFSTAPSLLLIVSTTVTRDFYKGIIKPEATDRQQLIVSRLLVVILGIVGTLIGLKSASILQTALGAFQIRAFAGLVLAIALFWPRVSKNAAFWSISIGATAAAIWHFIGNPFGIQPLWPSIVLGLTILIVLTLISKEPVSEGYKQYKKALAEFDEHEKRMEEENMVKLKKPRF